MSERLVEQLFPAFSEIKNPELREKSMRAMELAIEKGGWDADSIHRAPVTLNWLNCDISWIEHVTDVTDMCLTEFDKMAKYYARHGVAFDRDMVAAGALLHDIGKLTEFAPGPNETVVHSETWELMRHPLSGAILAAEAGLPDKLVHLIATHSFEGDKSYQTLESEFVRTVDIFTFQCSVKGLPKKK